MTKGQAKENSDCKKHTAKLNYKGGDHKKNNNMTTKI